MAGIHMGIVAADPQTYDGFADGSPWRFVAFQALLVLFGWEFLLWSVPAAWVLAVAARHDWPLLTGPEATTRAATQPLAPGV